MDNCFHFSDLFAQLGLPNGPGDISAFIKRHSPLPGDVLLVDAPFWDASQAQFLREKKATDSPEWVPLIDQLSAALREPSPEASSNALPRILGISGSLRKDSFNTALLGCAQQILSGVAVLEVVTPRGIPVYDGDDEVAHGLPPSVIQLRQKIRDADGLLISTPEYNSGMPGGLKNALDWVSRVSANHPNVLQGKSVALMGATPGGLGTSLAQANWLPVLRALGMPLWAGPRVMVSQANQVLVNGQLQDPALQELLKSFLHGYAQHLVRVRA